MKYKRPPAAIKYFIVVYYCLFTAVIPLSAAVNVSVTYHPDDRIMEDYINNTYDMTITVTFTGTDLATYNGEKAQLQMDYVVGGGDIDLAPDFSDVHIYSPKTIDNGVVIWELSASEINTKLIEEAIQQSVDHYHLDFQILYYVLSGGTPRDSIEIDHWGLAGPSDYLIFDFTAPAWSSDPTGAFWCQDADNNDVCDDDYFNSPVEITFQPNEQLKSYNPPVLTKAILNYWAILVVHQMQEGCTVSIYQVLRLMFQVPH